MQGQHGNFIIGQTSKYIILEKDLRRNHRDSQTFLKSQLFKENNGNKKKYHLIVESWTYWFEF